MKRLFSLQALAAVLLLIAGPSAAVTSSVHAADQGEQTKHSSASAHADQPAELPKKILSGYTSFFLNKSSVKKKSRILLDPMAKAKFNTVDFKIHGISDLSQHSKQYKVLKALADAIHQRDMTFLTYVYPSPNGKRNPQKDADLPAFVDSNGRTIETRFGLADYRVWRKMLDNAFQLAKVSRELGIAAVRFDLEHVHTKAASYDDQAWAGFAKSHDVPTNTPAAKRGSLLKRKHLKHAYEKWYFGQLAHIARRLAREMHAINPDLSLGVMPARLGDPFYHPFIVNMGTRRAPEIADNWMMYGGHGFTRKIVEAQKKFKQANPNLLFIPWFSITRYMPDQIPHQAYHAAMATDGYSNWVMTMLRPQGNHNRKKVYWLPRGTTREQYYHAYRQANEKVHQALSQGRTTGKGITFKPVQVLPASLYLENVRVPDLQPAGSGEGQPRELLLRSQQVIYIWARKGQPVRVDIRHAAGKQRGLALQYALLNGGKKVMDRGRVNPGKTAKLAVQAPQTGVYGLVIAGGGAWYGARVHNKHMAVSMKDRAYLFRPDQEVWVARSQPQAKAAVLVKTRKNKERLRVVLNKQTAEEGDHLRLSLPMGRKINLLQLRRPRKTTKALYTQDFYIHGQGAVQPLLFDGPERRLTTAQQQGK